MRESHADDLTRLQDIVEDFRTAMLVTATGDGRLNSRPMTVVNRGADAAKAGVAAPPNTILFVTNSDSELAAELVRSPSVGITMQDGARYVSMNARARLDRDPARLRAIWSKAWDVWFKGGVDDPTATLIDCEVDKAEYWDVSGKDAVRFSMEFARALVTGTTMRPERAGQHGVVEQPLARD